MCKKQNGGELPEICTIILLSDSRCSQWDSIAFGRDCPEI